MGMDIRQNLSQKQDLRLTPQMQQAIKLLQLNRIELIEQIQNELLENPTLEEVPGSGMETASEGEAALNALSGEEASTKMDERENGTADSDVDWNKVLEGMRDNSGTQKGASGMDELPPIETNLSSASTLEEHLEWQLQMQHCTPGEHAAAMVLIRSLDDHGWLASPLEEIVKEEGLDLEEAESALLIVQQLDPLGCGSRNLEECLLIQAKVLYPEDPYLPQILKRHLPDLEKRNYAGIAKALAIEQEDVVEYHKMIRTLEPWPGRNYSGGDAQYISPDVHVYKIGDEWQVVQNEDGLPKLKISHYYQKVAQGKDSTREEREYIKERLGKAEFLINSIYKRQDTISKVMRAILHRQSAFFDKGPDQLRPMILRDVADEIGVHESTVSRVTSGKYVQCPQGLFELKYFFNNGVNAVHGEQVAAEAVKQRVKKLIQSENRRNPYSDEQIVKLLAQENIEIARRTVAKYRDALGILPAPRRKVVD